MWEAGGRKRARDWQSALRNFFFKRQHLDQRYKSTTPSTSVISLPSASSSGSFSRQVAFNDILLFTACTFSIMTRIAVKMSGRTIPAAVMTSRIMPSTPAARVDWRSSFAEVSLRMEADRLAVFTMSSLRIP